MTTCIDLTDLLVAPFLNVRITCQMVKYPEYNYEEIDNNKLEAGYNKLKVSYNKLEVGYNKLIKFSQIKTL